MHHISLIACLVGSAVNGAKKVTAMPLGRHMNATRFKEVRVNGGSSGLTRLACLLAELRVLTVLKNLLQCIIYR
jgi:hypothetical protein